MTVRWTFALVLLAAAGPALAATPGQLCEKRAGTAWRSCAKAVSQQELTCVRQTGAACLPGDAKVAKALASVSSKVLTKCPDTATVTAAGYAAPLDPAGLVARLQEACVSTAATLVARSFGGPHLAVRVAASASDQACLDHAYGKGRSLIDYAFKQQSKCLVITHAGGTCDTAMVAGKIAARETKTSDSILSRCADLAGLIAVDPTTYVNRATAQARCLIPVVHGLTAPLTLDCGPRASVPVPSGAVTTQVVLPNATFGSKCGDGSDYAFLIRMPPVGQPADKVVVHMQGGGACYDGPGCGAQPPGLFEALSETSMSSAGLLSNTNAANPFRDWVQVFLPYCTQDLHIGGGITNAYTEITVHRHGALNTRAALGYVRDVVWAALDATDAIGYRPDRMQMMLSGSSAGGYGAVYNYHWVLDDLRWVHTTAVPDAALGMDNGTVGVIGLGVVALLPTTPGWNILSYLPPYCRTADCAEIFINLELAHAPRLKAVADQQILNISNQVDTVQRNTTLFAGNGAWVNELRSSYCASQDAPGIRSFFRASTPSVHGQVSTSAYYSVAIGGTTMAAWLGGAAANGDGVIDKIATGTIVPDIAGALPFPCTVSSPSGAFVD